MNRKNATGAAALAVFVMFIVPPARAEEGCAEEAKVEIAGREQVITVQEAELIKQTVEKYLAEEKPKLDSSVSELGEVFIDCFGSMRMGAWRLEAARSDGPELLLTFLIPTGENFRVHEVISLQQVEGQWRVTGSGRRTAHLKY